MIATVTGPPGSGKSFYAVKKLTDALEAGKFVATNIELVEGWEQKLANGHLLRRVMPGRRRQLAAKFARNTFISHELDELARVRLPCAKHGTECAGRPCRDRKEARGVMVLDEAHNWLNSRLWKDRDRLDVVRLFSQHRKLGWDIYLITQEINNIDRQVRTLFEYHVTLRNLRRMKFLGIPVSPINLFLAIYQWHAAGKAIAKREMFTLNKGVARLYDTLALSHGMEDTGGGNAIWLPRKPRKDRLL